jgi:putative protease
MGEASLRDALSRTGDSLFRWSPLSLAYPGGLFARPADLNRFRREFLDRLGEAYLDVPLPSADQAATARAILGNRLRGILESARRTGDAAANPPALGMYADTPETAGAAAEGGCQCVLYEPGLWSRGECLRDEGAAGERVEEMQLQIERSLMRAADALEGTPARLVWKWPRITSRAFLDAAAPLLTRLAPKLRGVMVEGTGAAGTVQKAAPGLPLHGGAGLNVMNLLSVQACSPPFDSLALSPELPLRDLKPLAAAARECGPVLEYLVQGNQELAVSRDFLLRSIHGIPEERRAELAGSSFLGLQDERMRVFPLSVDAECRTVIRNAVETCLLDHLPSLLEAGIPLLTLDARGRTARYGRRIAEIYRQGIEVAAAGGADTSRELREMKEEIRKHARGGITTAHFRKGPLPWEE